VRGQRARKSYWGRGSVASPLLTSYRGFLEGLWNAAGSGPEKKIEFGAFWNIKIASKQCYVAMKLYERVINPFVPIVK